MTDDTGFAPNPFWGFLTIATCKPCIRLAKEPGDWIAGFTSKTLCGDPVGNEKLVFLMEVSDKVPFREYFTSRQYSRKIPEMTASQCIFRSGDNIYRPVTPNVSNSNDFEQLKNPYHKETEKDRDLSGKFVLLYAS